MAWRAFGTTAGSAHRVRDSFRCKWKEEVHPKDVSKVPNLQRKLLTKYEEINYHIDCTTYSTVGATFNSFISYRQTTDPTMYVFNPATGVSEAVTYYGTWDIVDTAVNDNGDGTSRVTVSMEVAVYYITGTNGVVTGPYTRSNIPD